MTTALRPIHPFPARMAPEIALKFCRELPSHALVLDPMMGSGTTIRCAIDSGHRAVGVDMDPLAILMTRVWTTPIGRQRLTEAFDEVIAAAQEVKNTNLSLPWMDSDPESRDFVERWFAPPQRSDLRALAAILAPRRGPASDVCRLALSRTIVTKDRGASLARDVSHSRPHRAFDENDYNVFEGFRRAATAITDRLVMEPPARRARLYRADARKLPSDLEPVDAVVTSPPYLNAIDYLRGHRLSLVWLGHTISELRDIRGSEIGTERSLVEGPKQVEDSLAGLPNIDSLPTRMVGMLRRYALDSYALLASVAGRIVPGGDALFVVGNSCIKGVFVRNDSIILDAAEAAGLELVSRTERRLPDNRRYLPPPRTSAGSNLNNRMRTETVLRFRK